MWNRPLSIYQNSAWQRGLVLRHKRRKPPTNMFTHFFCLCPLSLTIKLNFNITKVLFKGVTPSYFQSKEVIGFTFTPLWFVKTRKLYPEFSRSMVV